MANATSTIQTQFRNMHLALTRFLTVAAGVTIYQGTLVSINASGEAVAAVGSARFAGIAVEQKTAGETVTVYYGNVEALISLPGVAATDRGNTAYAVDNQTAANSGTTAIIGNIADVQTDKAWVALTSRA